MELFIFSDGSEIESPFGELDRFSVRKFEHALGSQELGREGAVEDPLVVGADDERVFGLVENPDVVASVVVVRISGANLKVKTKLVLDQPL